MTWLFWSVECGVVLFIVLVVLPLCGAHRIAGLRRSSELRKHFMFDIVAPYRPGWETFEIWRSLYRVSSTLVAALPPTVAVSIPYLQVRRTREHAFARTFARSHARAFTRKHKSGALMDARTHTRTRTHEHTRARSNSHKCRAAKIHAMHTHTHA